MPRLLESLLATSLLVAISILPNVAHADVTTPFPGVTLVNHGDRALVIADLCTAGVSVRTTKYAERQATPEAWATRSDVNAAVATNGDFFDFPGWTYVIGRAMGNGEEWPAGDQNKENRVYWQFGPTMADLIAPASTAPTAGATQIIGGHNVIIRDGASLGPNFDGDAVILGTYRRTGIGLSASRSKVYSFASNTALDGSSMAASMLAMAAEGGAPELDIATNEDGGGSSQMYVRGRGQIIDSGRQVNNHFGIIANGSGPAPMCVHRPPTTALPAFPTTCGKIEAAHGLARGETIGSCDGRFTLIEQADGNLVLYGPKNKALWSNQAQGYDGYAVVMQADGNFVDYSPYNHAAWSSVTGGHTGAYVALQADGNLVVYDGGSALFNTGTQGAGATAPTSPTEALPPAPGACGKIESGHGLAQATSVASCDRRFSLTLQKDGNLVEAEAATGKVLWNTKTNLSSGFALWMQATGDLELATPYETTLWSSLSSGHPGATLAIQDDGNLVVYDGTTALWNSGTVDKNAPVPPLALADGGAANGNSATDGGRDGVGGVGSQDGNGDSASGDSGGCVVARGARTSGVTPTCFVALAVLLGLSKRRRRS